MQVRIQRLDSCRFAQVANLVWFRRTPIAMQELAITSMRTIACVAFDDVEQFIGASRHPLIAGGDRVLTECIQREGLAVEMFVAIDGRTSGVDSPVETAKPNVPKASLEKLEAVGRGSLVVGRSVRAI